jgi:hypothetical protein
MLRRILLDGLKTGAALAAATTVALMFFGKRSRGSGWAAVNAASRIVDRVAGAKGALVPLGFSPRASGLGLAVNTAAMLSCGVLYEGALAVTGTESSPLSAGLATVAIWLLEDELAPRGLSPRFARVIGLPGLVGTYAALGTTLALSGRWRAPKALPPAPVDETREDAWFV